MPADNLARAAERPATHRADGGAAVDLGFAQGGAVVDDSERPYKVLGPSKIWLSKTAKEFGKLYGLSNAELGRYLMRAEKLRESGIDVQGMIGIDENHIEEFQEY